jgi:hypothetical protein
MFKAYDVLPGIIWVKIKQLIEKKRRDNNQKGKNKFTE